MINVIKYYLYYRKHSCHHPDKVFKLLQKETQPRFVFRRLELLQDYSNGASLEEVAAFHSVTRERVRQIIHKFVRSHENPQNETIYY